MSLLGALSAIREVVVSKLFDFVLDKLGSSEFLQFATDKQIQEELQKLKRELQEIRALLDDAEERQLKDQSVKLWLSDLLNLAYDVDDVVDELQTEISRRNLMLERRGGSSKKPRLILDSVDAVMLNKGMMSKIKDITAKLKDLEPRKNLLQLRMTDCQKSNRIKERQQPTSLEIETHVYGRDKDKESILELVLKSDDEGNFVIPIVGMGGIGKTTLAQLVYNDDTVKNHFDLKAWVCVSDDFDVTRITKAIYQSVLSNKSCDDKNLNLLQEELKEEFSKKKFLIVLDDVWNENYHNWTILQAPFLARAPGSKIIVTTRNFAVSSTMGASYAHSLEVLSEDDCLSVFARHALGARDFGGHLNLKAVAEKIVRKCKGLPLAAKTLGGLLRTNIDYEAWKMILESEIWKLSDQQYDIIPALQLSYHHLPSHLKRCFAYCSILPKDYEFEEKDIILLWRAEGFLQEARDKHSIEDLGHAYFRDLVSRSLLQESNKDRSRFVMHDLINDLAQSVAGEICFRTDGAQQQISKKARHLSYIFGMSDNIKKLKGVIEAQHLRTFLTLPNDRYYLYSTDVPTALLSILRCLRVLSLSGFQIAVLPDVFGDLKHLRYLNFSRTYIKCLPESISKLYNLETLLLRDCQCLKKLPSDMENLINLCYLDISGAYELDSFSSNFGTLSELQILSLSNFDLHVGKGCHIRELEGLSNLKGQLCISGLENVVETQDAWKAKLHDMSGLDKLELKWSEDIKNRRVEIEEKVLDSLRPSKKVKELALKYYCGVRLAEWIGHFSFNKLQSLCLELCPNCISLPSIGQLPLLKKVRFKGLHSVTSVGAEFFGKNAPNAFPSLEILEFEDMLHWENWNIYDVDEEARKFPSLHELCFKKCPKLLGSIPECLPSLKKLVISERETLVISIQSFPMLSVLEIEGCKRDCESLEKLPANLHYVSSLTVLRLHNCQSLVSISKNNLPLNLKTIEIRNCEKLLCLLEEGENVNISNACLLEQLDIFNCPSLVSLSSRGKLPTKLKQLSIHGCSKLEYITQEIQDNSSLEYIDVKDCSSIKYLPEGLNKLSHLRRIHIRNCSKLVSFPESGLPTLSIEILILVGCDELQALPNGIHNLNSLKILRIRGCSSVTSFPEEGIPTNLRDLSIGGPSICKPLIKWGLQRLTSLQCLSISNGFPDAKLFPQEDIGRVLPCSLTTLQIKNFPSLEILSSKGFQGLTSLKKLYIEDCPKLKSLPEKDMLSSLFMIAICECPVLKELCEKNKGPEWSKIAHVPAVEYKLRLCA